MKKLLIGFGLVFFIIAIAIFRPVPIVEERNAIVEKGVVVNIYEGGVKDVVIRLSNNKRRFYINRGLENGLNLESLIDELMGKEITLKYPKYWTPLDWNNEIKHISKLEYNGKVYFNELK